MSIVSVGTVNLIMHAGDWSMSGRHAATCTKVTKSKAVKERLKLKSSFFCSKPADLHEQLWMQAWASRCGCRASRQTWIFFFFSRLISLFFQLHEARFPQLLCITVKKVNNCQCFGSCFHVQDPEGHGVSQDLPSLSRPLL